LPGYTSAALTAANTANDGEAAGNPPGDALTPAETALPAERPKAPANPEKIDLEIREKLFIAQTNEIYLNPEDYLGKTIRLEGLFKIEAYTGEDKKYCFVLRYGPGCCGNDGSAGFEVAWNSPPANAGVKTLPAEPLYPKEDTWVEAVGLLDTYEEDGYPYIYLDLFSLTEKEPRGAEFVSQ
jgi:uncharacterized membrane protein YcgQ (UPF0703/DUF1980 family)